MSWRAPIAGLVGVAAIISGAVVEKASPAPAVSVRGTAVPVDTATLVCPDITGGPGGLVSTMTVADVHNLLPERSVSSTSLSYLPLTGASAKPVPLTAAPAATVSKGTGYHAVVVTANGSGAGTVAADQSGLEPYGGGRALTSAACLSPRTDWWFAGADGRVGVTDTLILANPAQVTANITVTAWGVKGPLSPPRLQSIDVGPRATTHLTLSDYVPDIGDVAVHVRANSGSIAAAIYDQHIAGVNPAGADYIPPTLGPSTRLVIPGYLGSTGSRALFLANPGAGDATVSLRVVTASGSFVPAGHESLLLRAGFASGLELNDAFGGEPGAVVVTSDQPLLAEGRTVLTEASKFWESQWQPAATPLPSTSVLASNSAPFGETVELLLTAPAGAGQVRLVGAGGHAALVDVPAARTVEVDLDAVLRAGSGGPGAVVLEAMGTAPVFASRTLLARGVHGPLITAEQPVALAGPILLPPAVEDPRAAIR